jgi:hypothetical protein
VRAEHVDHQRSGEHVHLHTGTCSQVDECLIIDTHAVESGLTTQDGDGWALTHNYGVDGSIATNVDLGLTLSI